MFVLSGARHYGRALGRCCQDADAAFAAGELEMAKEPLKAGTPAPASGQFEIIGPRGGRTGTERTVTRGEPVPPTSGPSQGYIFVDRSKNGAGRGK